METHADYLHDLENQTNVELSLEDIELFFVKFNEFLQVPVAYATVDVIGDEEERYVRRCFMQLDELSTELTYVELINWGRSVNGRYQEEFWIDISSVHEAADMPLGTHYRFTKHDADLVEAYVEHINVHEGGGWDRRQMTRYDMGELLGEIMILGGQVQRMNSYHSSLE